MYNAKKYFFVQIKEQRKIKNIYLYVVSSYIIFKKI